MNLVPVIDKKRIAQRFGNAAKAYDSQATVQREVAKYLCKWAKVSAQNVFSALDIGCGTGQLHQMHPSTAKLWLNVDIAMGMLKSARRRKERERSVAANEAEYICADAENLPLQDQSIDFICSSMALQWLSSPQDVLNEIYRVLTASGCAYLAIMVSPSFTNLQSAWAHINKPVRTNHFATADCWLSAARTFDWQVQTQNQIFTSKHANVLSALHSVKGVGANTKNRITEQSVMLKSEINALQNYFGHEHPVLLDYQVCFIHLNKGNS